ncbi:MAG TPA: hypothetical protein VGA73_04140 [Candidatus Binatia bacterium]
MSSRAPSFTRRSRARVVFIALLAVLALWYRPPYAQPVPPLASPPLSSPDTTYPPPAGRTTFVPRGGDLQAALDRAEPGDVLALEAGATFVGNFVLPNKAGADWIVVRSAAYDRLPPAGTRVAPSDSPLLARIVTPNAAPALATGPAAHHFHFAALEITAAPARADATVESLVRLESPGEQSSLSRTPTDFLFERCYIHGAAAASVRRGITLNSARTAVVDSYLAEFHDRSGEPQAVQALMGWNGPGPFKIVNNYLAAAGENLVFGGPEPAIPNLVPADIEVRGNYFHKPAAWKPGDARRRVQDMLALKNAQRALIENNVFEDNWAEADGGFAVLFTVRNPSGAAPWSVVQDVTFRKNVLRRSGAGISILGQDPDFPSQQARRILIQDNLFEGIGGVNSGGSGTLFQILGGAANVVIDHNTGLQSGKALLVDGAPNTGFVYQNNIAAGDPSAAADSWSARFPGYIFARNVLAGGNPSGYPAENFFPASVAGVGFVDAENGDYRLAATSPFFNAGTDGANIGVDFDALQPAAAGAVGGKRNS